MFLWRNMENYPQPFLSGALDPLLDSLEFSDNRVKSKYIG